MVAPEGGGAAAIAPEGGGAAAIAPEGGGAAGGAGGAASGADGGLATAGCAVCGSISFPTLPVVLMNCQYHSAKYSGE